VCRCAAHAIDDVVDLVGKPHRVGDIEPHDERVVEELVELIDQLVGAPLKNDDPWQILTVRRAKVRRTFNADIGEPSK